MAPHADNGAKRRNKLETFVTELALATGPLARKRVSRGAL
jgi:hypothetical protein